MLKRPSWLRAVVRGEHQLNGIGPLVNSFQMNRCICFNCGKTVRWVPCPRCGEHRWSYK